MYKWYESETNQLNKFFIFSLMLACSLHPVFSFIYSQQFELFRKPEFSLTHTHSKWIC